MTFLGKKGQMFIGYKFIIGAIMALFMLMIIISGIRQVESIKYEVSAQRIYEGFKSAAKTPNGEVIEIDALTFRKGTMFSPLEFSNKAHVDPGCIALQAANIGDLKQNGETIEIMNDITFTVYAQCSLDCGSAAEQYDPIFCIVSFGKRLEPTS